MISKKLPTVALVALIMFSSLAVPLSGVTGTASAQSSADNCTSYSAWSGFTVGSCDDFDRETAELADKKGAFREAQALKADIETQIDVLRNAYYDAQDQAWKDAEEAFLKAYVNGENESAATQAGLDAMRDHYAMRQSNLIETQNNIILDLYSIQNEVADFSMPGDPSTMQYKMYAHKNYPGIEFRAQFDGRTDGYSYSPLDANIVDINVSANTTQESRTLANGISKSVMSFNVIGDVWYYDDSSSSWKEAQVEGSFNLAAKEFSYNLLDGEKRYTNDHAPGEGSHAKLDHIRANLYPDSYPSATARTTVLMDVNEFSSIWQDYQATISNDTTEFATWANVSYNELDNGTFDPEDILNKFSLMEQQSDIGEGATFSEAVAALAADGLSTPAGSTGYLNISYQTNVSEPMQTSEGMLFSQTAPPGESWELGHTYNSTELGGAQIVVGLDGQMDTIEGDFVVEGAYDRNGTQIDDPEISSPERTYQSSNITELREEIVALSDEVAKLNNQTVATPGGGAVNWPDLGIPNPLDALGNAGQFVMVVLAGFVILVVLTVLN